MPIDPFDRCECCGTDVSLSEHHVVPRSQFGSTRRAERDDPSNTMILCQEHHDAYHRRRLKIVRNENDVFLFIHVDQLRKIKNWDDFIREYAEVELKEISPDCESYADKPIII